MSVRCCLVALGALSLLAGCASSPKQADAASAPIVTQPAQPPPQVVEGSGTEDERTTIEKSDSQIYGAEHAMDPGAATESKSQNQGIP